MESIGYRTQIHLRIPHLSFDFSVEKTLLKSFICIGLFRWWWYDVVTEDAESSAGARPHLIGPLPTIPCTV